MSAHISRLIAARFQLDLMKSTMLLIARTDSESGKLLSSNVDISDHEFIVGTTTKGTDPLAHVLAEAEVKGATGAEIDRLETKWTDAHEMCTFNQGMTMCFHFHSSSVTIHVAVEKAIQRSNIQDKEGALKTYLSAVDGKSNTVARAVSRNILGEDVFWDWDGKPCDNVCDDTDLEEASSTPY